MYVELATGSFELICVGGVNKRRCLRRAYENSSDRSGSNYTEEDVDVYNCDDIGFSVACATLIYEGCITLVAKIVVQVQYNVLLQL